MEYHESQVWFKRYIALISCRLTLPQALIEAGVETSRPDEEFLQFIVGRNNELVEDQE